MMAQYGSTSWWMPPSILILKVNFNIFKITKAKWIFFITYNYVSLLLILLTIYIIVVGLFYFKVHLKLFIKFLFLFIKIF